MPSKRGARNHTKRANDPKSVVAQLQADPRMPVDYTICRELSIKKEDEDEFAQALFDIVRDASNAQLMKTDTSENRHEMASRFLTKETKLKFWPKFLVETDHKFLHILLTEKLRLIFMFLIRLNVYGPQRYFGLLRHRYGGLRNVKKCKNIMEGRIERTQLLEYVLRTHMEEADYMFLLEEKIKEYNSAEGRKHEEFLQNRYQRQLWIKSGNTGIFVQRDDFKAGKYNHLVGSESKDCVF